MLCSLCNGITLPPSRKSRAWFSLLGRSVASLNLSWSIPANSKKIGVLVFFPSTEELKSEASTSLCFWPCCFQQVELSAAGRGILCFLIGRMSGISSVPKQLRQRFTGQLGQQRGGLESILNECGHGCSFTSLPRCCLREVQLIFMSFSRPSCSGQCGTGS